MIISLKLLFPEEMVKFNLHSFLHINSPLIKACSVRDEDSNGGEGGLFIPDVTPLFGINSTIIPI